MIVLLRRKIILNKTPGRVGGTAPGPSTRLSSLLRCSKSPRSITPSPPPPAFLRDPADHTIRFLPLSPPLADVISPCPPHCILPATMDGWKFGQAPSGTYVGQVDMGLLHLATLFAGLLLDCMDHFFRVEHPEVCDAVKAKKLAKDLTIRGKFACESSVILFVRIVYVFLSNTI